MKIKAFIGTTMAAVMIAGCSNEFELTNETLQEGVLKVTVEDNNPVSRVGFDSEGNFYWSNTDYIGVTTSSNNTSFTKLTLQQGGGTASATFSGTISGTIDGYAIYPYSDNHSISGTQLTFNFPDSYTYTKVDEDFFTTTQGDGNSFNPAMVGKITNNSVTLKHLGGVFCIKVSSMPVESGKLTLTADKKINGGFTYNLSDDTFAETTTQSSTTSADEKTVAINFSGATTNSPGVFYIPVPEGTYSNIRIKMYNGSGDTDEKINVAAGTYTIKRKDLKVINLTTGSIDATTPTTVENASDVSTSLESNDAVSVSGEITGTSTINIPTLTEENTTKSLILENIASGADLTISESSSGSGNNNSVENFTLSIPNNDATDFTPLNLNINLPNTTVALAANAGTATFNEVTASTADNTLIIEEGVTVKKLIVKKGNVRVNKGATLTEIAKGDGNTSTVTIYKEEGAVLPNSTEGFEVVNATIADIEAAASSTEENNSYILQSDITLNRPLVVTAKNFTLDLNGHALKANAAGLEKVLNTSDAVILVRRGATLTINDISGNGSIDANNVASVYGAVKLTDTNDGTTGDVAKLIVNNGQLKGYYYGIVGNGTRHNTEIIVNDGKIMNTYEEGSGIYHPQEGKLTVTGGEIVGTDTGIELRSGTLNIQGGTVRGTRTDMVTQPNGSGTTISGAALAISQHTTNKNISVTISGGTFEGYYALYEEDLQDDQVSNISIAGISNGVFNGKIYSENCSNFISGGTFSDPSALDFAKEGANIEIRFNKDTELDKTIIVKKGITAKIILDDNRLTASSSAIITVGKYNRITAIAVEDGATAKIYQGIIGDSTNPIWYGVYAYGKADVTLNGIDFSERVTYAYNGAGKLTANDCIFRGWLSGWHHGGEFSNCTFTIGKEYYPANICYGNTKYNGCKFFKNGTDADVYDDTNTPDSDGYYRCNYVVAACNPTTEVWFDNNCTLFNEDNTVTESLTVDNHPYHACSWGDGTVASANVTVNGNPVTSLCSDAQKAQNNTEE